MRKTRPRNSFQPGMSTFLLASLVLVLFVFFQLFQPPSAIRNITDGPEEAVSESVSQAELLAESLDWFEPEHDLLSRFDHRLSTLDDQLLNDPADTDGDGLLPQAEEPEGSEPLLQDLLENVPLPEPEPEPEPEPQPEPEPMVFREVDYPVYVAVGTLNLRAEPSTESAILMQLKLAEKAICLAEHEDWLRVDFEGQTGYISRPYTSCSMVFKPVDRTCYVAANTLNMRAEPSTQAEILQQLRQDSELKLTGIGDGWSQVKSSSGVTGYVASKYLVDEKPIRSLLREAEQNELPVSGSTSAETSSSEDEIALFTRIVAMESYSQYGYEGYLAVATVIMNRVDSRRYPNTITDVVSQPGQFSVYTSTRTPYYNKNVHQAVADALAGKRNLPSYVLFFAMPDAYESNVERGGVFSKLEVYSVTYNHVWCYYAADRN